jgi:hypothetical protein
MEEVGLTGVEERCFIWPINTWPKDARLKRLGMWYRDDFSELVKELKAPLVSWLLNVAC